MRMRSVQGTAASLVFLAMAGCADGTAVVTGVQRSPISPDNVRLYSEAPQVTYETIALVNARSDGGLTDQGSINYAIEELKEQAAAVGANGVILGQPSTQTGGFLIDDISYPYDQQTVAGRAIYVSDG